MLQKTGMESHCHGRDLRSKQKHLEPLWEAVSWREKFLSHNAKSIWNPDPHFFIFSHGKIWCLRQFMPSSLPCDMHYLLSDFSISQSIWGHQLELLLSKAFKQTIPRCAMCTEARIMSSGIIIWLLYKMHPSWKKKS